MVGKYYWNTCDNLIIALSMMKRILLVYYIALIAAASTTILPQNQECGAISLSTPLI